MKVEKVADKVYRVPVTAGEYVGIFAANQRWVISHPRLRNTTTASFRDAKRLAFDFIRKELRR